MIYVLIISPWCAIPTVIYIIVLIAFGYLLVPAMRETKRLEASGMYQSYIYWDEKYIIFHVFANPYYPIFLGSNV